MKKKRIPFLGPQKTINYGRARATWWMTEFKENMRELQIATEDLRYTADTFKVFRDNKPLYNKKLPSRGDFE